MTSGDRSTTRTRRALARLVGDVDAFAADVWEKRALLRTAEDAAVGSSGQGRSSHATGFADLFTLDDIDELVSVRGLRTPFLRLVKDNKAIAESAYIGGGGVGATVPDQALDDGIYAQMADGATLVLQGLHRMWPALGAFARELADDLGHPTQVNAYVTPAQSQGFGAHYDVHDVFVLQLSGEKRWIIHEPVFDLPLPHQPSSARAQDVHGRAAQRPVIDTVLRPGDVLYLPRGYLHSAKALGGLSAHLTIGVPVRTRYDLAGLLLDEARARIGDDVAVRAAAPFGSDPREASNDIDVVRAALHDALDALTPADLEGVLERTARASARPEPIGPLAQLRARTAAGPSKTYRLRGGLRPHLERRDDGAYVLSGRFANVVLPPSEHPALQDLLGEGVLTHPADEAEPAARLIARLLDAAVVVPV